MTPEHLLPAGKRVGAWFVRTLRSRPRLALIGTSVAVMIAPLLMDLLGAIPFHARKAIGWGGFTILVGTCAGRLMIVRSSDDRPAEVESSGTANLWSGVFLTVSCVLLAVPILSQPGNLGFGDWDYHLAKMEAARRSVLLYGQFPWWDPWTRGGFPLAANPQCGVLGVAMPAVLIFGATVGMAIATVASFALAAEGSRRLARLWVEDPVASAAAGLIYAINGAVLVSSVAGYHMVMSYLALPWMLYFLFRLDRDRSDGFWLGLWGAFSLLNGIQYLTVFAVLIASVVWLRVIRARPYNCRMRLMKHTLLALGTFLALAGWRIATTGLVYRDFPRVYRSGYNLSPWDVFHSLTGRPGAETLKAMTVPHFWETTTYVGPVVLVLAGMSLARGWRWWHTLAFGCGWLAVGDLHWYHPSYWLGQLPVFGTMHVVTRWRFMALLGVALAAASVLASWRKSPRRWVRVLAVVAIGAIALDYLEYGFEVLPVAFSVAPEERLFPGPELEPGSIIQVRQSGAHAAVRRGYGVIHGYEPMLGYNREAETERLWDGHSAYEGEFWTEEGPVRPLSWTPNRIVLSVAPNQQVFINQNPGSWWWVNGVPANPEARSAEMKQAFLVRADPAGRVVLEIHPRGLRLGIILHIAGLCLIAGVLVLERICSVSRPREFPDGRGVFQNVDSFPPGRSKE